MTLQGLGGSLVGAGLLAVEPEAHQPPAAHHRDGRQFALQPRPVVELAIGEQGHVEGIVGADSDLGRQDIATLAHLAAVAAVDHHRADLAGRGPEEALDLGPLGEDHEPAEVPGVLTGAPAK